MRRKILLIIIALLIIIIAWAPLHFEIKKEIRIDTPVEYVGSAFTDLHHWKNWNVAIKSLDSSVIKYSNSSSGINASLQSGDKLYTIIETNPVYVLVRASHGRSNEYHSIFATSDSLGRSTRVVWIRSISPMRWLKEKVFPGKEMEQSLKNLKNMMEDPLQLYGFPISIEPVKDTLVITSVTTCAKKDKIASLGRLYSGIFEYANKKELPVGNFRMASFSFSGSDSLWIAAGIPTTKKGPKEHQISVLEMPSHGRMLVGRYEGPYGDLGNLYTAMEKYTRDKHLRKVATVYEKYLTDPKSAGDSLHMRIELYFPIY